MSFSFQLVSLSIMPSKSIHISKNGKNVFFLWLNSILFYTYIFFIHSYIDGCFGFFRILAVVNNAAMNTEVYVSFRINDLSFLLERYPGVELLGHMVVKFLVFLRKLPTVFQWLHQVTFSPTVYKGPLFSTSSSTFVICILFDDSHSDRCEMIPHCDFNLQFPDE